MITLTIFPIVPCLRKSPHLIAEFHWSLNICKQVKNQITTQLINGLSIILLGTIPVNMTSKLLMLIAIKMYGLVFIEQ